MRQYICSRTTQEAMPTPELNGQEAELLKSISLLTTVAGPPSNRGVLRVDATLAAHLFFPSHKMKCVEWRWNSNPITPRANDKVLKFVNSRRSSRRIPNCLSLLSSASVSRDFSLSDWAFIPCVSSRKASSMLRVIDVNNRAKNPFQSRGRQSRRNRDKNHSAWASRLVQNLGATKFRKTADSLDVETLAKWCLSAPYLHRDAVGHVVTWNGAVLQAAFRGFAHPAQVLLLDFFAE